MGYEVGYRLVERACQRRWMGGDQLEAIKFVCKDLWSDVRPVQYRVHRILRSTGVQQ